MQSAYKFTLRLCMTISYVGFTVMYDFKSDMINFLRTSSNKFFLRYMRIANSEQPLNSSGARHVPL